MNARSYFSTESLHVIEPIEELSRVSLVRTLDSDEGILPEGSAGTVVSVYDDGAAYCVEFTRPFQALVTVLCGDVKSLSGDGRAASAESTDKISD